MVMFRDDELRMIAAERAAEPRWKKRLRLAVKIVLSIGILFFLSLTLMSTLSGHSDALKSGIEQYVNKALGLDAEIETLNYMSFYPEVRIDFDGLNLYYPAKQPIPKKGDKQTQPMHGAYAGSVGHFAASMGFWDLFFSRNTIRTLVITDAASKPGVLDRRAVVLHNIRLDPKGHLGRPAILLDGRIGDRPWSGWVEMVLKSEAAYGVPDNAPFEINLGPLRATGTVGRNSGKGLVLNLASVTLNGERAATGVIVLSHDSRHFALGADLASGHSRLTADLEQSDGPIVTGTLNAPVMDVADIKHLLSTLTVLAVNWPGANGFALDLSIGSLIEGTKTVGQLKAHLEQKGSDLKVTKINGTLDKTVLGSDFDSVRNAATFNAPGLALEFPVAGPAKCAGARLALDADSVAATPVNLTEGTQSYSGTGAIGFTSSQTSLSFGLSPVTNNACVLP